MKFIDTAHDPWHTITGEDGPMVTLTPAPNSLLTLAQWRGVPERLQVGLAHPGQHQVLVVHDAHFGMAETLGDVGGGVHLGGRDVAGRDARALDRQRDGAIPA